MKKGSTGTSLNGSVVRRPKKTKKWACRTALIKQFHVPAKIANQMTFEEIQAALAEYRRRNAARVQLQAQR